MYAGGELASYLGEDIFATEALTLEAIKALDSAKEMQQPFYLYMSHYAIHIPIDKDMRYFQKYIDAGLFEKEDKSQHNPDVVQELSRDLGEYIRQVDAQRPSFKARGEMCPKGDFTLWNIVFHLGEIVKKDLKKDR